MSYQFNKLFLIIFASFLILSTTGYGQEWIELNEPPFHVHHSNGFGFEGKGYIFQGSIGDNFPLVVSNKLWEYTPESDTWKSMPNFPGASRGFAIGDDWDGKYYYGFGRGAGDGNRLNDLWVFNPADTTFTQLPFCPCEGRSHPAFIAHDDKVYVGTGSGLNGDLDDWWIYDILTQEWTQKIDLPGGVRHHPFAFTIDEKVFVGGGHVDNWQYYDPIIEEWFAIDDSPGARVAGTQFSYNNKGFLLAGDYGTHDNLASSESFMRYDFEKEEWDYLPPHPLGSRWAPSSFIIDGDLYFFGGIDYSNSNNQSMWKFSLAELEGQISSIDENPDENKLIVFPNPFEGDLSIQNLEANSKITIINIDGQTVIENAIINEDGILDLNHLQDGIYFIKTVATESIKFQKVLKQSK